MDTVYEKVKRCFAGIHVDFVPEVAVVLGSGLGDFADDIRVVDTLPYDQIEGFPVSTVIGHKGRFVFGYVEETPVVIMQGRVHFYEGYDISDVVLPIRLMAMMGATKLLLTNAAGGLNLAFKPGDFMLIRDHISSFVRSPLIGPNVDEWGTRFPAMDSIYDDQLSELIKDVATKHQVPLQEGVYIQMTGPQYESKSEVKMCQLIGGDAVGMSTAVEAIAAKHMGMRVCGITCISNMACGISKTPLNHKEVGEVASAVAPLFKQLLEQSIANMKGI